jgi:hypothetical protein
MWMPSFLANIISNGYPLALVLDGEISRLSGHNGTGGWKNPDKNRTPEESISPCVSAQHRDTLWLTGMSRPSNFFKNNDVKMFGSSCTGK